MKRRTFSGILFTAIFATLVAIPQAHAESANKLFKQGRDAEARDDIDGAYSNYYKAYQQKPKDEKYRAAYYRTRELAAAAHVTRGEKIRVQGDNTSALTEFVRALEIDPSNQRAAQGVQNIREKMARDQNQEIEVPRTSDGALGELAGPIDLKPISNEPLTLHAAEDTKVIYQTVGKAAGINVLFDPDYTSKRVQVDLSNVSLQDALRIIGTISNTFWRPITSNTIFVAANTRTKRTELDQEAVQTFYLTNVAQQNDFTDVQTALRNVFQTAKLYGVASQNAIIMRGTPDELLLAQKLVSDLDKAKAEVVIDVAVMEVSRDKTRSLGIQLPQSATINFQQSNANSTTTGTTDTTGTSTTTSSSLTLNNLAHLNSTNFAVSIGQAQVNALLSDGSTKILQNPQVRASDGQQATLKIGQKIPVATGSYQTGAATAIVSSLVNTQFQYLDVGVNIDVKPQVHYNGDVTMKIKVENSTEGTPVNLGGINEPVINQRTVEQTIRLKEGEASILGGILQRQTIDSLTGWPGLGELPILKWVFASRSHEVTDSEIVFVLIPHVVRAVDLSSLNTRQVDTGTGNTIELRRIHVGTLPAAAAPTAEAQPAAQYGAVSNVQGGAAAAAQQAVTNMQQSAAASGPVTLQLTPARVQQKVGSTFQVTVNLTGGADVFSVPMQLQYDQAKLSLINVDLGDSPATGMNFLGKDGQAVALVHRDDGNGGIAVSASRPPGAKGVSGSGTVCILTFQAKAPGDASIAITRPMVRNSMQQPVPATGSQAVVQVQ